MALPHHALVAALVSAVMLGAPSVALADEATQLMTAAGHEPDLDLEEEEASPLPTLVGEVHLSAVIPFAREPLCPVDRPCVLGGGGGIGGTLEHRWSIGFALFVGYDAWFLDSDGVYEIGVLQLLRAGARYVFMMDSLLHPFLDAGVGLVLFGDTFLVSAAGGAIQLTLGAEIELSDEIAMTLSTAWRFFVTSEFSTSSDRTVRGGEGLNAAVAIQIGFALTPETT